MADLLKRDKLDLDIFWLKDESLDDVDSLPPPDEIAADIVENLQAALEAFQSVAEELAKKPGLQWPSRDLCLRGISLRCGCG